MAMAGHWGRIAVRKSECSNTPTRHECVSDCSMLIAHLYISCVNYFLCLGEQQMLQAVR